MNLLARRAVALDPRIGSHIGPAVKMRSRFNGNRRSADIADQDPWFQDFDLFRRNDIALNVTARNQDPGRDVAPDDRFFPNRQCPG